MSNEVKNRFDRIVAILTQLQSTRVLKAQDLADRFSVSLRTIYRDIRSLEEAGVPVSGEAGIGYSLMEGYRLPPVMFTREEAASFVAAGKLMEKFTDNKLAAQYDAAMGKIRSVLRSNLKDHVDTLATQVWAIQPKVLDDETPVDSLGLLFECVADKTQVSINYHAFGSEEALTRVVEPVALFFEENNWNMMAWCTLRNDYRQFRTDRILEIQRLSSPFLRTHPAIETFRKPAPSKATERVVIRVDRDVTKYLRSGKKYYGLVSEEIIGRQVRMTFMIQPGSDGLARWFMMFGDGAEIMEPQWFRDKVRAIATELIARSTLK